MSWCAHSAHCPVCSLQVTIAARMAQQQAQQTQQQLAAANDAAAAGVKSADALTAVAKAAQVCVWGGAAADQRLKC